MMLKWIKRIFNKKTKLNKEKKEERKIVIDTVLEWTIYVEEFGA